MKDVIQWLDKRHKKARSANTRLIIGKLRRLVEAAELAVPKPPAPSATAVSEPPYSPGYLPEALPRPPAPTMGEMIEVLSGYDKIVARAKVLFETEYPDRTVQWDQLNAHTQLPYIDQARRLETVPKDVEFSQAEIDERARKLYMENRVDPSSSWENLYEQWKNNWRSLATVELREEHRARDRYEETKEFNDPSWTALPQEDRNQWIVNERNAMR